MKLQSHLIKSALTMWVTGCQYYNFKGISIKLHVILAKSRKMSISDYDTQANTRLTWCLLLDTWCYGIIAMIVSIESKRSSKPWKPVSYLVSTRRNFCSFLECRHRPFPGMLSGEIVVLIFCPKPFSTQVPRQLIGKVQVASITSVNN